MLINYPLSIYRTLWLQVIFDLPVLTKNQRKTASKFRNYLLDFGFEMVQFSVYQKFCQNKEIANKYIKKIEAIIPAQGKIQILTFTDKQYSNIITFYGKEKPVAMANPKQYSQF